MTPERLNEARKQADLSWLALARKVGLSERHMRRLGYHRKRVRTGDYREQGYVPVNGSEEDP